MCGICGFVLGRFGAYDTKVLEAMCDNMRHRGPDDAGYFLSKGRVLAGLGHRRLSIIDLSESARQPMGNEDGTVMSVVNGEIYNYTDLRRILTEKGHFFRSGSDSEVIPHLYEEYGDSFATHLRGMFAAAVWDVKEDKLVLVRDRMGKKPLVYAVFEGNIVFASEFRALLAFPGIERSVDRDAIAWYLRYGYIPSPMTAFRGLKKLEHASYLVYRRGQIAINKYWKRDLSVQRKIGLDEAAEELYEKLNDSVRVRMMSDVPLGAFLSGGVDSSAVVAMMARNSQGKVRTFSIGFRENAYNELGYARAVSEYVGTEHSEFIVEEDAASILPALVEAYGEPFADSSSVPTFYVAKMTAKSVKVALSGDGGDENFAGYDRIFANRWAEIYRSFPGPFKALAEACLGKAAARHADIKNKAERVRRFLRASGLPIAERYEYWLSIADRSFERELYTPDFLRAASGIDTASLMRAAFLASGTRDIVNASLYAEQELTLPNDYLVKVDIASMLNSLEVRSPFLDQAMIEFSSGLPSSLKQRGTTGKIVLKHMIRKYRLLPECVLTRGKMGFAIPVSKWLREGLSGLLSDALLSTESLRRGYFAASKLKEMLSAHMSGKKDYGPQLWALLVLELWHRRYID
ncbi:MAG: asparagine synthase (glutamine-hydrolyzing) [Candidatus Omnitrophica bacterium]|nr:asparagine synthase (glutamine-hydrolyzing) [Candidatus Omnitrophota bacterium]